MNRYQLKLVGSTKKAVGFEGGIRLEVDIDYEDDIVNADTIWITQGYETIPFFVKSIDENWVVYFDEITSRESVTTLSGKPIYLLESKLKDEEYTAKELSYDQLVGLMLYNGSQAIGEILSIEEYPQQDMLVINYNGQDRLIPIHQNLIESFDPEEGLVMMLPEGLLDI